MFNIGSNTARNIILYTSNKSNFSAYTSASSQPLVNSTNKITEIIKKKLKSHVSCRMCLIRSDFNLFIWSFNAVVPWHPLKITVPEKVGKLLQYSQACQPSRICRESHDFNIKLKVSQAVASISRYFS